jgi:hypothetical protein
MNTVGRRRTILQSSIKGSSAFGKSSVPYVPTTWKPGQRPFASSSPANQTLDPSTPMQQVPWDASLTPYAAIKFYIDIPDVSAPIVTFLNAAGWGNPQATFRFRMTSGMNGAGALTGDTIDNEAISFSGNKCWSLDAFTRPSDTSGYSGPYGSADVLLDSGFGTVSAAGTFGAGVVGPGASCLLGALVKEEFTAGEILHWVSLAVEPRFVNQVFPNYYLPGISNDGFSGNGFCSEGQIFAIPAGVAMPSGLSSYGQKLFRACQNYGVFLNDTAGATVFYLAGNYNSPTTTWTGPDILALQADAAILIPMLYKTGYVLDGMTQLISPVDTCAPQLQTLHYGAIGLTGTPGSFPYYGNGHILNITRDSDGTNEDIGNVGAPTGFVNTAGITSFCSGTTGRCATYFGQFGNVNFTSAGSAAPIIYQSGALKTINGHLALAFDGSTNYLKGAVGTYPNGTVCLNAVVQVADHSANYGIFGSDVAGGLELRIDSSTGFVRLMTNTGTTIAVSSYPVALNQGQVITAAYATSNGGFYIRQDGFLTASGTNLVTVTQGNILVGAGGTSTDLFKGLIAQWLIVAPGGMPSNAQTVLENYEIAFYNVQTYSPPGNLLSSPNNFLSTPWIGVQAGAGVALSTVVTAPGGLLGPDGISQAYTLALGGTGGTNNWSGIQQVVSFASGVAGEFFVYMKSSASGGAANVALVTNDNVAWSTGISQKFALTSSWQRFTLSGALQTGGTNAQVTICNLSSAGSPIVDATCNGNVDIAFSYAATT